MDKSLLDLVNFLKKGLFRGSKKNPFLAKNPKNDPKPETSKRAKNSQKVAKNVLK
jgi:hypothetical protein